ncbi:MAG: adenine nucleotide alpha hydrolase, partial [Gammaproteobacteria bacterium]
TVQVYSGTNTDDLGDYRPGLVAADEHRVRHPFVEAAIDKQSVRAIAAMLGLDDLAELPASPCLSSRIQTGIRIEPAMLSAVHVAERAIADALSPSTVRCRVRRGAVVVELDEAALTAFERTNVRSQEALRTRLAECFAKTSASGLEVAFETYKMGSAFVRDAAAG